MANSRILAQGFRRDKPHIRIIPASTSLTGTETKGWLEARRPLILGLKAGLRDVNVRMLIRGHARHEEVPDERADYAKIFVKPCSVEESVSIGNDNSELAFAVPAVNTGLIFFKPGVSPNVVLFTQSRSPCTVFAFSTGAIGHLVCPRRGYIVYPVDDSGRLPAQWSGRLGIAMPCGLPGNDGALVPAVMGPPKAREPKAKEVIDLTGEGIIWTLMPAEWASFPVRAMAIHMLSKFPLMFLFLLTFCLVIIRSANAGGESEAAGVVPPSSSTVMT